MKAQISNTLKQLISILKLKKVDEAHTETWESMKYAYVRRGLVEAIMPSQKPSQTPTMYVVCIETTDEHPQLYIKVHTPIKDRDGNFRINFHQFDADSNDMYTFNMLVAGAYAYMREEQKLRDVVGDEDIDILGV